MALKQGKKQVNLQAGNMGIISPPTTNITAQIAKPISEIVDSFRKTAEIDAKVNWKYQFDQTTRDHYLNLQNKFRADPEGMRNAIDTYSKTVLANTPNAFKSLAQNILANKNLMNMNHASTNLRIEDTRNAKNGWEVTKQSHKDELNNALFTIDNNPDSSPININNEIDKNFIKYNENYFNAQESLVETGRTPQSQITTDLDNDIENAERLRVLQIMKNIGEVDALKYIIEYASGKDSFKLQSQNPNNPIFKKYENYLKDPFTRADNVKAIKNLYTQHIGKNIFAKSQKPKINLDELKEVGKELHAIEFIGGAVDANALAEKIGVEPGSNTYKDLIEYVAKTNNIQRVVSKTMQNENKIINWDDEGVRPEEWATVVLANNGINKVRYGSLNTDGFITAMNLFSKQDYYPPQVESYLKINKGADYQDESSLNNFKEKADTYKYVQNLFPNVEYPHLYEKAINAGAIDEIENGNFSTATNILKNIDNENFETRLQNIANNENNTLNFRHMFNEKVRSPNWALEMMSGGKDELNQNLFTSQDQSTFFAMVPSNITPPLAYKKFENFFNESIANMTSGTDVNQWSEKNKGLVDKAWNVATRKLKQSGWGIETNTFDGQPKLVKDPYWRTHGEPNFNDIYSHVKKNFMTDKNAEDNFGTNNWKIIQQKLNQGFDNQDSNVKFSIDRQMYNDENGNPAYKLTLWEGDMAIPIEGNFKPGWTDYSKKPIPGAPTGSIGTLINDTTNEIYENFIKSGWFNNQVSTKQNKSISSPLDLSIQNQIRDYEKKTDLGKKFLYSIIRNGLSLSEFRFYPDIPGLNDQPAEIRPFAFVAKMMGYNGDFREISTDLATAAQIANNKLSMQKKINLNRNFSNLEKITEAQLPPEKTIMSNNVMELNHKNYALENYNNTELRLTHRTNNWGAVSSDNWDGELALNYQRDSRKFAVFAKPKDSIRAAVKTILNHSTLTASLNEVDTRYSSEPPIKHILMMYAEDSTSYLKSLEQHTNFKPDDTIDLMDSNQMYKLLKFITQHEMGFEYFNEKFGKNNPYVNSVIFTGFEEAINSYNGELGKL